MHIHLHVLTLTLTLLMLTQRGRGLSYTTTYTNTNARHVTSTIHDQSQVKTTTMMNVYDDMVPSYYNGNEAAVEEDESCSNDNNDDDDDDVDASMLDHVSALGLPSLRDASVVDVLRGAVTHSDTHDEETKVANVELQLQQEALRRRRSKASVVSGAEGSVKKQRRRLMGAKVIPDIDSSLDDKAKSVAVKKVQESLRISSHEEEIELARAIQLGAKVNIIKADLEQKLGRPISKTEWSNAAGVGSASHLRRIVSDYRKEKNKLVMANIGLVHAVVKGNRFATSEGRRMYGNSVSYEELVQEGSLGLLRAAELFDPERGLRFSTYATIWIKGVLSNTKVYELITTPTRERSKMNKIRNASVSIKEMNEEVSYSGIAEITGLTAEEVGSSQIRASQASNPLSLDYSYTSSDSKGENRLVSLYGDAALMDHNDAAALVEFQTDVLAVLTKNLKPREAEFICLRYGIKDGNALTLTECAKCMGISYSRAQQLAKSCIKKLQEADDAKTLQEYLLTLS